MKLVLLWRLNLVSPGGEVVCLVSPLCAFPTFTLVFAACHSVIQGEAIEAFVSDMRSVSLKSLQLCFR